VTALGACFMFVSAILILESDLNVDRNHQSAAKELTNFQRRFNETVKLRLDVPQENHIPILTQVNNLAMIQTLCALSQSR